MRYYCPAIVLPKKCIELTKLTMVFLPLFYHFLLDEKSESGNQQRIEFCVNAHSPFPPIE